MELPKVLTCPLGSKCQDARDGVMYQCAWFTKLAGKNPNTGEAIDEHGCAMSWVPVLLIENSAQQRSTSAGIESFRNEMVKANETGHKILAASAGLISLEQQ